MFLMAMKIMRRIHTIWKNTGNSDENVDVDSDWRLKFGTLVIKKKILCGCILNKKFIGLLCFRQNI